MGVRLAGNRNRVTEAVEFAASDAPVNMAMISAHASPLDTTRVCEQSVYVAELSAALVRLGHRVTVYTRRDNPDLPERVEAPAGYEVVHVPAGPPRCLPEDEQLRAMGPFAQFLAEAWTAARPDAVHAHFWTSGIAGELAARQLSLPTVLTMHGFGADDPRRRLESKLACAATWIAAGSEVEALELIRMGRPRTGTAVIPCGVDVNEFRPDGPQASRSAQHRIVSVGKVLAGMGFDSVIRALRFIPDVEYLVVGEAELGHLQFETEASRLRGLAEQLGIADRVRLLDTRDVTDLPSLLRSADVVACTPSHESSGIVALEAMACGVPVVASEAGALRDIVVHDVTGYLVRGHDPRELAASVNSLLRDSFLRRSFGGAGRDRATARYTWDRVAADASRLYEKSLFAAV